jgi:hypothetical protein
VQLYWVLKHGTYLTQRQEEEGSVNLYHCADESRGIFMEVGYDASQQAALVLRSFSIRVPL